MIVKSKAPFRLGLAGGGTDVSPYSDKYGGAVFNATVNLYAYATIIPKNDGKITLNAKNNKIETLKAEEQLEITGHLDLQKGIYNRIVKDYTKKPLSFELITEMDVPSGSGLGTSSTLVVSILGAFLTWLDIPLTTHEIARLAYQIEREDLQMAGGKQDQYAASFGGINLIEFQGQNVTVNPVNIPLNRIKSLEKSILLYYTKTSRKSAKIIEIQADNVIRKLEKPIQAMHFLKKQAYQLEAALKGGDLHEIGAILDKGWEHKKQMAIGISNPTIDEIYSTALMAGAYGGKISGAGGGGFMLFYVDENHRDSVIKALAKFDGNFRDFHFEKNGLTTWLENA